MFASENQRMDGITVEHFSKTNAKVTLPISACQATCVVSLLVSYRCLRTAK